MAGLDLARAFSSAAQVHNALVGGQQEQQLNAFKLQDAQRSQDYQNALSAAPDDKARIDVTKKYDFSAGLELAGKMDDQARKKHADDVDAMTNTLGALSAITDDTQLVPAANEALAKLESEGRPTAALKQAIQQYGNDPTKLRPELKQQAMNGLQFAKQLEQQNSDRTYAAGRTDAANAQKDKEADNARAAETARLDAANKPLNADGTPNKAYQKYEMDKTQAGKTADEAGWQLANDPTSNTQYRINVRTGQTMGLDGKPYSPQGAGKIASGSVPRSPATAAFMKWQSENPNATAADYQQMAGKISQTVAGGRALGGGQDGAGILAANAVSQHIKVYEDLAQAMNNGDVQAINSAKNRWQQEFGTAAPTNAAFANQIIGPELVKAIIAGGGTGAERDEMEKALSTNKSWEQAAGLSATAKRLLGGQLAARQKKFTFNGLGSTDDFRKALEPEAQNILDQFGGSASSSTQTAKKVGRFTVETAP